MSPRDPARHLTTDQARRAIYLDFEGRKGHEPFLLGALVSRKEGRTEQLWYAWDPRLRDRLPEGMTWVGSFERAVGEIVGRSERGIERGFPGRRIVTFSIHERSKLIESSADPVLVERFEARWCNGLAVAKRWRKGFHPTMPVTRDAAGRKQRLGDYLAYIGMPHPAGFGDDVAADAIKRIERSLDGDLSADTFLARTNPDWGRLLGHNAHDCEGLRELCLRAAADLGD